MTFEEALKDMREGNKVSRRSWWATKKIWFDDPHVKPVIRVSAFDDDAESQLWEPSVYDISADDWEVVDYTPAITMDKMTKIINKNMENAAREIFGEKLLNVNSCVESFGYECCSKPDCIEINSTTIIYLDHTKN